MLTFLSQNVSVKSRQLQSLPLDPKIGSRFALAIHSPH